MARVLVVEDDADIRGIIEFQLRKAGHKVIGATTVAEARDLIAAKGVPEVLVLDVGLPGVTGVDFLAELREQEETASVAAIFLSARVTPEDISAGQALGAVYLTKPFVATALLQAVERVAPAAPDTW